MNDTVDVEGCGSVLYTTIFFIIGNFLCIIWICRVNKFASIYYMSSEVYRIYAYQH